VYLKREKGERKRGEREGERGRVRERDRGRDYILKGGQMK
jgi:hypothetical protein